MRWACQSHVNRFLGRLFRRALTRVAAIVAAAGRSVAPETGSESWDGEDAAAALRAR